ncbi:metal ABC transporter permease [Endozoicomonas gorgoniicola]|uniref:Metal ABC transporter permease n=1 Tax=Endozoicomonas gorgoniicola TaxID=1234144 RepID=A0ABT3N1D5_9GAMM|nr:metal ABC transporter permease [Endozoicomonas gorgoniicola]MCW7555439.1 metal ABC transporter permease [Endozoicomonas gorgoniicola]
MVDISLVTILLPSFCGGVLILISHLILGRQVLSRGIVFMDLAVAQIAAMGAVIAHIMNKALESSHSHLQETFKNGLETVMPFVFSIAGACLISKLSRRAAIELEAIIGCIYILAAACILLVLASDPHGAEHISDTLGGRLLWIQWSDLQIPTLATITLLAGLFLMPQLLTGRLFYPVFAIMITMSVKLSGVYLVFTTLIMPALAISGRVGIKSWITGYSLGIIGIGTGLMLSSLFDYPGGASIVVMMAVACALFRVMVKSPATVSP